MTDVTFDHRLAGTPASVWRPFIETLRPLTPPSAGEHLVVVAAHPDDETLGAGGLIATAAAAGARVTVIVASDGEASHPRSPTHSRDELAARRRDEVHAAVAALAPGAALHCLGLPDGRLAAHGPALTAAVDALADGCTQLVTPWAGDHHPDHEACAWAVAASDAASTAQQWQYPIWAWHWSRPDAGDLDPADLRALLLDPQAQAAKTAAIGSHRSQHSPLSAAAGDEAILPAEMLAHFRTGRETYVVAAPSLPAYFAELYATSADPWGLHTRFYERRKRALLLAALVRPRFRRAFEPGCAGGLLTAELAGRCAEVVAWDAVDEAVQLAAERLHERPGVTVDRGRIPADWPPGEFDLVVLSEVGYYCADLDALVARVDGCLAADGVLVACHWRHPASMHAHSGDAVHAALGRGRRVVVEHVEADFRLDVWTRDGVSVAAAEGIVG